VLTKEISRLTFGMAVSGENVNQKNIFQHQLCLFSPVDGHLQKMASCNFYLNTWRQINFQQNCKDKRSPTT